MSGNAQPRPHESGAPAAEPPAACGHVSRTFLRSPEAAVRGRGSGGSAEHIWDTSEPKDAIGLVFPFSGSGSELQ